MSLGDGVSMADTCTALLAVERMLDVVIRRLVDSCCWINSNNALWLEVPESSRWPAFCAGDAVPISI